MKKITLFIFIISTSNSFNAQLFTLGQFFTGGFPSSVLFADLDADNDIDLIRTKQGASGSSPANATEIWFNNGQGNFTLHQSLGNTAGRKAAVGDLDNDGDLDIFVAHGTMFSGIDFNYDKVWINNGTGFFSNNGQLLDSRVSTSVVLADFDSDGDLDAFVGNEGDFNSECTVWFNDGNAQFTNSGQLLGVNNSNTYGLVTCDVDNDLDIDVIAANCCVSPENTSRIWINDGIGNFTMGSQNIGSYSTSDITLADMNGDSHLDVILANLSVPSKMYFGDGNGNFIFHSDVHQNLDSRVALTFDYDLDGDLDLLLGEWGQNQSVLLNNDGLGNFTEVYSFPDENPLSIAYGDVDNDTDIDLYVANINNEENRIWLNSKYSFQTQQMFTCQTDSVYLGGNWVNTAGNYLDTFPNIWGGDSIVETNLSIVVIDTSIIVANQTLIANAIGTQYQWFNCDTQIPILNQVSQSFIPAENGNYAVEITKNGCVDTSFCYEIKSLNTFEGNDLGSKFSVFNNINEGNLIIKHSDNLKNVKLKLLNMNGQEIFSKNYSEQGNIELEFNYPTGIYFLTIQTEQITEIVKLSKFNE